MNHQILYVLQVVLIGFATGLLSGGFGIGGGTFCTPVLRLLMGLSAHVAVGSTMALIIPTALAGAWNYARQRMFDLYLAVRLVAPAMLGTIAGAHATRMVEGEVLMVLFSVYLALAGLDLLFGLGERFTVFKQRRMDLDGGRHHSGARDTILCTVVGLVCGFMAGFFGVGGGVLLVPALLYLFNISTKAAFGTSLLVIVAVSIPGTLAHFLAGHIDFSLTTWMIVGALPGSYLGSKIALRMKDSVLRKSFALLMIVLAGTLIGKEMQTIRAYKYR